jgi:hypothetical protein
MLPNETQNPAQPNEIQVKARNLIDKFVSSVSGLVNDITALEVNTMVVAQITGIKFNPWEAYQEIYSISDKDYFQQKQIPERGSEGENLHERYRKLFIELEREYFYLLIAPDLGLLKKRYHQEKIIRYQQRLKYLKENQGTIVESDPKYVELARPILPNPAPVSDGDSQDNYNTWQENIKEIQQLLENDRFLRNLRKLSELKAALNSNSIESPKVDIIYAQTVMQLDGDIISRYHKKLFEEEEDVRNLIIKIHTEGVVAGEKQWRGVLDFIITTAKGIANSSFLPPNGRR